MPSILTTLVALAAAVTPSAAVSRQQANNWCAFPVWITYNSSGTTQGPFELPAGSNFATNIVGTGNSLGVSFNSNFYSPSTPKLILGTSTSNNILYWSVNDVDGDPFAGRKWNVSSSPNNVCSSTTNYGTQVYACQDNNVLLSLQMCAGRAPH